MFVTGLTVQSNSHFNRNIVDVFFITYNYGDWHKINSICGILKSTIQLTTEDQQLVQLTPAKMHAFAAE